MFRFHIEELADQTSAADLGVVHQLKKDQCSAELVTGRPDVPARHDGDARWVWVTRNENFMKKHGKKFARA
jgi:hypothetical protein